MRKEFRFLLQSARINLALVAGYAAVLTLGAILFPAPEGERNLFYNYFISAPITVSFILFIMSFSMGANNLNISLTLGGRRRDYFWALQPVLALYVGTSWWSGAFWSPVLEDGITWTSAKAVEKGRRFRRKRLPFFIMPVFPGAAVISRAGTRLLWYPRDGSNALKAAYLMALVRTSSARRAWNWTQDMAPRSSPERMRTETV